MIRTDAPFGNWNIW